MSLMISQYFSSRFGQKQELEHLCSCACTSAAACSHGKVSVMPSWGPSDRGSSPDRWIATLTASSNCRLDALLLPGCYCRRLLLPVSAETATSSTQRPLGDTLPSRLLTSTTLNLITPNHQCFFYRNEIQFSAVLPFVLCFGTVSVMYQAMLGYL